MPLKVLKAGMLTQAAAEVLACQVEYLRKNQIKLVVDPVMVATSGSRLTHGDAIDIFIHKIVPGAFVCMLNFAEAEYLWSVFGEPAPAVTTVSEFQKFAVELQKKLQSTNTWSRAAIFPG